MARTVPRPVPHPVRAAGPVLVVSRPAPRPMHPAEAGLVRAADGRLRACA